MIQFTGQVDPIATPRRQPRRAARPPLAMGAGLAVLIGAFAITGGLVAAPGPWTAGYVSEAGTAAMPGATAYRLGLLLLAAGVVALGAAHRATSRPAALLLGIAGLLAGASGAVPCSTRCPLPPFQPTTAADLLHGGASTVGMAVLAIAMIILAVTPSAGRGLRSWAVIGSVAVFPTAAVMAGAMAFAGRAPLTAAVERVLLAIVVCWLAGAALAINRRTSPTP